LFGKWNIYYCFYFFPYEFKVILFEWVQNSQH
jgi:hypothetical protein